MRSPVLAALVLLVLFLRALIAPLYLLAVSALVVLAALGLTTLVFQDWLGHPGLTYYVPFAAAVLLAVPSHAAAPLVRELDAELAGQLGAIGWASCASVHLVWPLAASVTGSSVADAGS